MKITVLSVVGLGLLLVGCSQPKPKVTQKQYQLTGKVVSIDMKAHTAAVDAAAIPNYMDAMTMDYPIASATDLAALKAGEQISATINVAADGSYSLTDIRERSAGQSK